MPWWSFSKNRNSELADVSIQKKRNSLKGIQPSASIGRVQTMQEQEGLAQLGVTHLEHISHWLLRCYKMASTNPKKSSQLPSPPPLDLNESFIIQRCVSRFLMAVSIHAASFCVFSSLKMQINNLTLSPSPQVSRSAPGWANAGIFQTLIGRDEIAVVEEGRITQRSGCRCMKSECCEADVSSQSGVRTACCRTENPARHCPVLNVMMNTWLQVRLSQVKNYSY